MQLAFFIMAYFDYTLSIPYQRLLSKLIRLNPLLRTQIYIFHGKCSYYLSWNLLYLENTSEFIKIQVKLIAYYKLLSAVGVKRL